MKSIRGIILAMVSSGTFGLIPLFSIPLMMDGMNEPSILFYRFLFSTLIMGLICLLRKESFKISRKYLFTIFMLGLLYAATALFLIYSYHYIPSGAATTIHFMYPILVSVLMVVFFKEKKSVTLFFAAILSLTGVILMCWSGGESIKLKGLVIASMTVVTYSTYIVGLNQSKVNKMNAEILTFYILLASTVIFLFTGAATGQITTIPGSSALTRLLLLALMCTVISDLTLILAIKYVGSTITSILGSMEPLVAVLIGIFYFSEKFTLYSFIGIALIIISVMLVVRKKPESDENDKAMLSHEYIHDNKKQDS